MTMTPLDLNHDDRQRLDDAAIDRFYEVYPVPDRAAILLELNNELMIAVSRPSHVDDLMDDRELLEQMAYLVFGTTDIAIYLCGVEVWRSKAECDVISEVSTPPMKNMSAATAVIDKPSTVQEPNRSIDTGDVTLVDTLAADMNALTGLPSAEWKAIIINSSQLFVSNSAAEALIDRQIDRLQAVKARLKSDTAEVANGKAPAAQPAAKKAPARKSRAKKPATP